MSNYILKISLLILSLTMFSCSQTKELKKKHSFSVQIGTHKGGIVENTDMAVIDNYPLDKEIDAYSGATSKGFNIGVHTNIPLIRNEIEFGLDILKSQQEFKYDDDISQFYGKRSFKLNQWCFPITYNFKIMPNNWEALDLQFKIGLLGQFSFINTNSVGNIPDYSINPVSGGFTFGISFYPFQFANNSKLGFYLDGYRGSQIYEDFYNSKDFEMPGTAYVKYGLKYKF